MFTRYTALIFSVVFTAAAAGGFVPFITPPAAHDAPHLMIDISYGYLIGLYPVNVVHNLVHLSFGIVGVLCWRTEHLAKIYARMMAFVLGLLTILGAIPAAATVGGVLPLYGHAIWLHGLEAVFLAYVGFLHPIRKSAKAPAPDPASAGR